MSTRVVWFCFGARTKAKLFWELELGDCGVDVRAVVSRIGSVCGVQPRGPWANAQRLIGLDQP